MMKLLELQKRAIMTEVRKEYQGAEFEEKRTDENVCSLQADESQEIIA